MTIVPGAEGEQKDMKQVRNAYADRDEEASRQQHELPAHREDHGGAASGNIKNIVFGGLDGMLTTFAVVTAAAGSANPLPTGVVLIFGFANLFADGFAMGFGEFTSSKAQTEYHRSERQREEWELDKNPNGEKQEMVDIYTAKGFSAEDATTIVETYMKYPKDFVDLMMVVELDIMPEDEDPYGAVKDGCVMFISFCIFGAIPLLAFVGNLSMGTAFIVSCVLTAVCLAILGAVRGLLSHKSWYVSSGQMVLNGAIAAVVSYFISYLVSSLVPASKLQVASPGL